MRVYAFERLKGFAKYEGSSHSVVEPSRTVGGVDVWGGKYCYHYDIPDALVEKALSLGATRDGCPWLAK